MNHKIRHVCRNVNEKVKMTFIIVENVAILENILKSEYTNSSITLLSIIGNFTKQSLF